MPTFTTPEPISATIDLVVGEARITAGERDDTVVDVRPSDGSHEPDVRAAEQTKVEFSAGRLLVKGPRQRGLGVFGKVGSIAVTVELPAGSQIEAGASIGALRLEGRLGECRLKISAGDIQVEHSGRLEMSTAAGAIAAERVDGDLEASTGSGQVRVREIDGSAVIKSSNGHSWIGEIHGDLRVNSANGDIRVDNAHADVTAATANGDVRIGEVRRGAVSLKTALGEIEVGIPAGTAARLDVHTSFGRVINQLAAADSPEPSDETLDVRARTSYGDIVIRRSATQERTAQQ